MSLKIAVASSSFSQNKTLCHELHEKYPDAKITLNSSSHKVLEGEDLIRFMSEAERVITGLEVVDETLLKSTPHLKHISKYGVGLDMLSLSALENSKVTLGFTPGVNKRAVSELALSFMLELIRGTHLSQRNLNEGNFKRHLGFNLTDKIIGVIGCGNVGKDLIELLKPFHCKILVTELRADESECTQFFKVHDIESLPLHELLKRSDIVTIHVPKNETTEKMISTTELSLMKPSAFILNTARGGIIDEIALLSAIESHKILGAALDVFENEPKPNIKLINHPHIIATPHIGGGSHEAMLAMGRAAIENLENFSNPLNFKKYQ